VVSSKKNEGFDQKLTVSLVMVADSSDSSWWFHFLYPTLFGTMISDDFLIQMSWQFGRSFLDQLCQAPWMLD